MKFLILLVFIPIGILAQRPLVPYNAKGVWGFADTSGNIVIKPFCKYPLSPISISGLSKYSSKEQSNVVDTNGNIILTSEHNKLVDFNFYSMGIRATELHALKTKEGKEYIQRWFCVFNNKGIRMPLPLAIDIEFLQDTNFIEIKYSDSILLYKVSWWNAKSQLICSNKLQNRHYGAKIQYGYKNDLDRTSIKYITNKEADGKLSYYWANGNKMEAEEVFKIEEEQRKEYEKAVIANGGIIRNVNAREPTILREDNKYKLKLKNGFSNAYDHLALVYQNMEYRESSKVLISLNNEKLGLIDTFGNVILDNIYDEIEPVHTNILSGMFIIRKVNKWGLCNIKGEFLLKIKYDEIENIMFHNAINGVFGFIRIELNKKEGLVNRNGAVVLDADYDYIDLDGINRGYLNVTKNKKYGLIDTTGKMILPVRYDYISVDDDNIFFKYILIKQNKKQGLADINGKIVLPPVYKNIEVLHTNYYPYKHLLFLLQSFKSNDVKYMLNTKVLTEKYDTVLHIVIYLQDNKTIEIFKVKQNNKWGLLDSIGNVLLPCEYDDIQFPKKIYDDYKQSVLNNFCVTKKNHQFFVFEMPNKQFILNNYDSILCISQKYFLVKKQDKWGIINNKNEVLIDFQIDELTYSHFEGLDLINNENDVCIIGKINNQLYFFSNITNYEKIPLGLQNIRLRYGSSFMKDSIKLKIERTRTHIVIIDEKLGQKSGISYESFIIAGQVYYYYKIIDSKIEGYIREDGKMFFER